MILSTNNKSFNHGSKQWYALQTKPRQEFKAEAQLKDLGIENYLPVTVKKKNWSDRIKEISEPIIRGYIFIKSNERERLAALEQTSICKCLFDQGKPAIIPDWQIYNLKRFLQAKSEYFIINGIVKGVQVEITQGPFSGVIGIVQESSGKKSIAVSMELLNRTITAYLPNESIEVLKASNNY